MVFDIGETLVDETRIWESWADWLRIPRLTLLGMIGWGADRDVQPSEVVRMLRPGVDIAEERRRRAGAGVPDAFLMSDLYPDVAAALAALVDCGFRVGICGNQPRGWEDFMRALPVELSLCASSGTWGVSKPDPRFFTRIAESLGLPAPRIAYVGDRLDNDVQASLAAGMVAVHIRRGPWGWAHAQRPEIAQASVRIDSLLDLLQ